MLNRLKKHNWIKHWAGEWSILTCTNYCYQYTNILKKAFGISLDPTLFISRKGYSSFLLEQNSYYKLGEELARRAIKDNQKVIKWCNELKKETDKILNLVKNLKTKEVSIKDYEKYLKAFYDYGIFHRAVKVGVDFLPADLLKELLPKLEEARIYAEPVYAEIEKFMQYFSKQLSKKCKLDPELILCMKRNEFDLFLKKGKILKKEILEERYVLSSVYSENNNYKLFTGEKALNIERAIIDKSKNKKIINGKTAYPGKVKGKVRIVLDPEKVKEFRKGDILVTGMTRPEYLYLIKKSAAYITDAGGMLSHAAITARELKKPCLVGTEVATKVLKDGDEVEVDAKKGVIKILNN